MSNRQREDAENDADTINIVQFAQSRRRHHEPPATDEELAEYRQIRVKLLKMLDEWEVIRGQLGCPVMRNILGPLKP